MEKLKPDVVLKNFWRDNERFASLFNTVVFGGEEVILPENLEEADTDLSNIIELKEYKETLKRSRDVIKKTAHGVDFVIMGIENQQHIHYAMPLRIMLYDSLGYLKEYQEISRHNKKSGDTVTEDEFLSALKKEDRLHPIISIVIYYGENAWDGPLSLKDMIVEMPDQIATVFSDYKMNLLQVRESSKYHFRNEDVQTVFQLSEYIFSKNFDEIQKEYEHRNIKAELATVIGTITESDVIMKQAAENEGGYVSMCGALESLKKQGIEQGIKQGINQRNEEIVIQMLKREMNKGLIKEITGVDEATIDELHKKIQM